MALNLTRFEDDLKRLQDEAHELQLSMIIVALGEKPARELFVEQGVKVDDIDKTIAKSKNFGMSYQGWYSEGIALLKQLLPDRLEDFKALYERPKNRKSSDFVSYVMSDFLIGVRTTRAGEVIADQKAAIPKFQDQIAILQAAQRRFKSSLFEIRQLVQADLFDSEIDSARELLKNKFLRAAGAVAGVVLEKHLKQVCDDHSIKVLKKNPAINDLNQLLRDNSVIDVPQWRHITMLADVRNICDHNKQKEPTDQQVSDLIDGTDKVIKTVA
jgi:hypothetical protein